MGSSLVGDDFRCERSEAARQCPLQTGLSSRLSSQFLFSLLCGAGGHWPAGHLPCAHAHTDTHVHSSVGQGGRCLAERR